MDKLRKIERKKTLLWIKELLDDTKKIKDIEDKESRDKKDK